MSIMTASDKAAALDRERVKRITRQIDDHLAQQRLARPA
jgi:hypothetical protein